MIKKSKGFTMIEVLTVIAVLGIIVLLAAPRFLSYIETAKLAQIKNDVKVHENHIESRLVNEPDFIDDWEFISNQQMEELRTSAKLYDKTGLVEESETVIFTQENKIIPKKTINTKLKGIFLFDNNGKVYYYDGKVEAVERLACEDAELQGYICIYTVEDLRRISHDLSARYILMNDLDLSSIENWQPIGHETGEVLTFTGEFNGNNYSIKNLKINDSELDLYSYSLFGDTENATFKNITMTNSSITLGNAYVSSLVGRSLESGLFENISIESFKVSGGSSFVGGVVGKSENTKFKNISISNSESIENSQSGGVTGISEDSEFKNISINNIEFVGDWAIGGVTGYNINSSYEDILVSNSTIGSTDYSGSHIGGVIGNSSSNSLIKEVKVLNSHVKGISLVGGIVGSINTALEEYGTHKISQAEFEGEVEGYNAHIGGIVGAGSGNLEIEKVKVNVDILGNKYIGGIAGSLNSVGSLSGAYIVKDVEIYTVIKNHPLAASLSLGDEMYVSGGVIGQVNIDDEFDLTIKRAKVSGEIHTIRNSGGVVGDFHEARYSHLNPNPTPKTMYFEDVSSSVNFIETLKDPGNRGGDGYYSIGGIVGYLPDIGSGKLNLKNVYYDGNMNISDFYEVTEDVPKESVMWRNISPIVSLSQMNYNFEEYIQNWNSIVETENVYWIKENSPGLEPFDLLNLGK